MKTPLTEDQVNLLDRETFNYDDKLDVYKSKLYIIVSSHEINEKWMLLINSKYLCLKSRDDII